MPCVRENGIRFRHPRRLCREYIANGALGLLPPGWISKDILHYFNLIAKSHLNRRKQLAARLPMTSTLVRRANKVHGGYLTTPSQFVAENSCQFEHEDDFISIIKSNRRSPRHSPVRSMLLRSWQFARTGSADSKSVSRARTN